ncbi:hypothetical protein J6590_078254 [Homalodisca vitripennis]|nr:hypothetical protein J6590_078254 [Homalodisca vitripennis]
MRQATSLRGTVEWAPPRPQIIFTPHPAPDRRKLMSKQNYRCAGCGMQVAQQYANKFRYCEYLGRYFCTGCHTNQLAIIPGRVIQKWDFTSCEHSIAVGWSRNQNPQLPSLSGTPHHHVVILIV